jgi:hypothetical protein
MSLEGALDTFVAQQFGTEVSEAEESSEDGVNTEGVGQEGSGTGASGGSNGLGGGGSAPFRLNDYYEVDERTAAVDVAVMYGEASMLCMSWRSCSN